VSVALPLIDKDRCRTPQLWQARGAAHLSQEHAALHRVATLVAECAPPQQVFEAVTSEVAQLLGLDMTILLRFEPGGIATCLAETGWRSEHIKPGDRIPQTVSLPLLSGTTVRTDDADPTVPGWVCDEQVRGFVICPITIEGRIWGAFSVGSRSGPLPSDTEQWLADFTTLIGTAIANAECRAELAASRARLVAAADETRRRIERDLHDGAQQRLVSANLTLRLAQATVPNELLQLRSAIGDAADQLSAAVDELRETARGIHPAILTDGGLRPALRALARRSPIPVELHIATDARLPQPIEVAAYYVVSETLTNATKHAHASLVIVSLVRTDGMLRLTVHDDGVGDASPHRDGSGLLGLRDRVEALDGVIDITSPPGVGTTLRVTLPISPHSGR
jgi:signal transduction histidine kinase